MILNLSNLDIPEDYYGFVFITYFPNGKIYVGITTRRVHKYYFGSGNDVKNAIKYFEKKNLKRKILRFCITQSELDSWERIYIKKFDSRNPEIGYNIQKGGHICKHDERTKIKIGQNSKLFIGDKNPNYGNRFKWDDEQKKNLPNRVGKLNPNYGRRWTDEMKSNLSSNKQRSENIRKSWLKRKLKQNEKT